MGRCCTQLIMLALSGVAVPCPGASPASGQEMPVSPPSAAEPAPGDNVVSYPAGFFAEFRPNSALDMVSRIPGFTYSRGDASVRGLAGSGGNVLIDGQRPASKSLSLDDVLRRIPVDAVARIDVVSGGAPGLDMQGQTIVANLIRVAGSRRAFAAELFTKLYTDGEPARGARLEGSLSKGNLSVEGSLNWRQEKEQANSGIGHIVRRNGSGEMVEAGRYEAAWDRSYVQGTGAAEYRLGANLFRLSLSGEEERQDRLDAADLRSSNGSPRLETVIVDDLNREGEVSLAFERRLGAGLDARLLIVESRELDRVAASSARGGVTELSTERARAGESIVRAAATYLPYARLTLDARIERAFNFLDSRSSLSRDGVIIPIPSANVRVEERRIDGAASARFQAWEGGTFEAGLAYERSTISQAGDVDQSKSFAFLKPRASASIDLADWQIRLRAERIVGQLDFEDFASRASLDTGTVNAGNPELEPEKSWLFEAVLERRFWGRGAASLTISRAWLQDVIDLVPIDGRFDAPGNIGEGTRDEASLSLVVPLERLSVPGGLIRFKGSWRRSEVVDPVTLLERRISYQRPFQAELLASKDLPALRSILGIDLYSGFRERSYRIGEIRTERASTEPLVRAYWDWIPTAKTSLRFQIENFAFRNRSRQRILYRGVRRLGIVNATEHRSAVLDPFLLVRLRRSF